MLSSFFPMILDKECRLWLNTLFHPIKLRKNSFALISLSGACAFYQIIDSAVEKKTHLLNLSFTSKNNMKQN